MSNASFQSIDTFENWLPIPCFYAETQQPLTWGQALHNVAASGLFTPYLHTCYDEIDPVSLERTRQFTVISNPCDAILTVLKVILAATIIAPLICYVITNYMDQKQIEVEATIDPTELEQIDALFNELTMTEKEMFLIDFLKKLEIDENCSYQELYQIAQAYQENGLQAALHKHLVAHTPELREIADPDKNFGSWGIGYSFTSKISNLIFNEDVEGIEKLIDDGYPPNKVFYQSKTCTILHHAANCDKLKVVVNLVEYLKPDEINAQDSEGDTALSLCIPRPIQHVVHMDTEVEEHLAKLPRPRVIEEEERIKTILKLIEYGADPNIPDNEGRLPLHHAVIYYSHCNGENLECIKTLAAHTKDKNLAFSKASLFAIRIKSAELLKFFIELGARLDFADGNKMTPLHHEAYFGGEDHFNPEIMEIILQKEPHMINKQSENGATALHIAAGHCNAEMVKFLAYRGASATLLTEKGEKPKDYAQYGKDTINEARNDNGRGVFAAYWHLHRIPKANAIIQFLERIELLGLRFYLAMGVAGIQNENFATLPTEVRMKIANLMLEDCQRKPTDKEIQEDEEINGLLNQRKNDMENFKRSLQGWGM